MANLPPSRRDNTGPPSEDGPDVSPIVRHHASYLESLDPGIVGGRFATPRPVGGASATNDLVGGDADGDATERLWEWDDRHTVTATGTQLARLSHEPFDESLFVRWHPAGRGGLPLTNELFTLEEQTVIIPDTGVLAVGDQFSFQYEYEDGEDALALEYVGCWTVTSDPGTGLTITCPMPTGTEDGDLIVIAVRGGGAPGGGDITLGAACADSRVSQVYAATPPVVEVVFVGFASASTDPIVVDIINNPSYLPYGSAVIATFRGINAVAALSASEAGTSTPVVEAAGAIAVTWVGNSPFALQRALPPSDYSSTCDTGLGYTGTGISYWTDPSAEDTIAGTFAGEGCLIIGVA